MTVSRVLTYVSSGIVMGDFSVDSHICCKPLASGPT